MKSLLILPALLLPLSLLAATPEERGLEIAAEVDRRDTGWHDWQATMTMLLRNKHGEESLRHMRSRSLEVEDDGDKSLIVFDRPRDVKGTALLSYSHKTGSDDQWLYLPALKRVKRIASRNKSGPFMGSEFAYEDLSSQEIEKYTYQYIQDDQLDDTPVFLIERDPVDPNSGYSYQRVWIDQQRYIPLKIEFYDRKQSLLKTLEFRDYRQYLNQYWRANRMFMQNHQTGKSTLLTWEKYAFRTGLDEQDFSKNSLKRVK
ncbi:MAG: outer membrane lipoprotein-sorting protein [Gammaproteobacteria bacterium]|nr:outer membrane lipoprotein-sorting protein [Gammaproteobacteria bacterium]